MIKERIITITQKYKVCDYCRKEIIDSSYVSLSKDGCDDKHFHSMQSGGKMGVVEKTCIELFEAQGEVE